jgi:hypothetical protein
MTVTDPISKAECELRCGAYKHELHEIDNELHNMESKLVDIARWQAEHDGRINAWWEQQFRVNKDYNARLRTLERKVIWASGAMAAIGAVLGGIVTKYLGG